MTQNIVSAILIDANKTGETGETGTPDAQNGGDSPPVRCVSNAEFIAAVFGTLPSGAYPAVCTLRGDPNQARGWPARRFVPESIVFAPTDNNYLACSSYFPGSDGSFHARKEHYAAYHALMCDDVGTKASLAALNGLELSWRIETSPGNFQCGFILEPPLTDGTMATELLAVAIQAGLCDPGASSPMTRWARLPVGINGKAKYRDADGTPFECRLVEFHPDRRYRAEDLLARLRALGGRGGVAQAAMTRGRASTAEDDVLTPRAAENPAITNLKVGGLYKTPLGSGRHDITCPWCHEHTDALDTGAAYFEPDDQFPLGGFCCKHSHGDRLNIWHLLDYLGLEPGVARHKPLIRLVAGELHRVIDAAERALAEGGQHFQTGALIVRVMTDAVTGDPAIVPCPPGALLRDLSQAATWERPGRDEGWMRCDPSPKHATLLSEAQRYRHLPPLDGLARQPYFCERDGRLVRAPGYDPVARRYGVFDPKRFEVADTREAAQDALKLLEDLLAEFPFVTVNDRSAALAALLTAVVRPSVPLAPAFHVRAPVFGSGKTYLCELIGAFAGPAPNAKVSYPGSADEATKVILALLLGGPAVVEFDDMDTDWIPHGIIKRMLTAQWITDRLLGGNKTATVSTRTLFLGSGNNVGPVRDLLRRVLQIHLDPRSATPALRTYRDAPVARVRKDRERYVSAALTLISAWIAAGRPRTEVVNIASFDGAWSDFCRHPLIWLGIPDPALGLQAQIRQDPDAEALHALLAEWHAVFGSAPTTVRHCVDALCASGCAALRDAICEFPVEQGGQINRNRFGWLLKKYAHRVVGEYELCPATAQGRAAWRVLRRPPPEPPEPAAAPPVMPVSPVLYPFPENAASIAQVTL
jgi:hypothetical protein